MCVAISHNLNDQTSNGIIEKEAEWSGDWHAYELSSRADGTECLSRLLSTTLQHFINWRLPKAPSRSSAQQRIKNYLTRLSAFHVLTSALLSFSPCVWGFFFFFFFWKTPHHSSRSLTNSRHHSGSARCPMGAQSATSATTTGTCTHTWRASTRRM